MENPKDQLIERIKSANNVLVTVSSNPSVDQLSAAIGLTLMLNKMGKHATAVYSGSTPSTIEFLKPEKTFEKNTDSLRDFIIALDKSKADKLRYKVEEDHVKIFITPYRTTITEKDLDFSHGDFNVDVVVALGVTDQKDLDQAITAHGRILHDATTVSVTTGQQSNLGTINWADHTVSSLCEMVASIADDLQVNLLDGQMATSLMTGIVAETKRFSNEKTTPGAMSASAKLMAAGANQQLVASKLQETPKAPKPQPQAATESADVPPASEDGSLQITHAQERPKPEEPKHDEQFIGELPDIQDEPEPEFDQIHIDSEGTVNNLPEEQGDANEDKKETKKSSIQGGSSLVLEPPTLGGKLTANTEPEHLDPATDPLAGGDHDGPILSHDAPLADVSAPSEVSEPEVPAEPLLPPSMTLPSEAGDFQAPAVSEPSQPEVPEEPMLEEPIQTLTDIEKAVSSTHVQDESQPLDNLGPHDQPTAEAPSPLSELSPADPTSQLPDGLTFEEPTQTDETPTLDSARDAVSAAIAESNQPLPPIAALNAQPLDLEIRQTGETGILDHIDEETGIPEFKMPENLVPPTVDLPADPTASPVDDPTKPPEAPPPFMPGMPGLDPNSTLPPLPQMENTDQQPQSNPQNPFNLPPA